MKTLVISVDYPLPEDKGNRMRTMHFVRAFKQYGDVDIMCYSSHAPNEMTATVFRKEHYIDLNKDKQNSNNNTLLTRAIERICDCKPWIVQNYTEATVRQIHDIILSERYDIILCRYSVNAYPLLTLPEKYRKRVILDIDDLMSGDLYDVMNGEKKGLSRVKAAIDKVVFYRYQRKCLELDHIVFCSEDDRRKMRSCPATGTMFVVPNIIPSQNIPETYQKDGYGNKCLLFVGALSYQPNEMGILWFIREIFEKLPDTYKDVKLLVVGKSPREELIQACSKSPRIELVINPPDVVPYFERSSVVVVPLLVGGGTRIKILEAGNCCRPVISTRLGAYGLDLKDYESVLFFDDKKSFVEKLSWLDEKNNYHSMVDTLSNVVKSNFTHKVFTDSVATILESIMKKN